MFNFHYDKKKITFVDFSSYWNLHNPNLYCLLFQYPAFYQTTNNFSTNVAGSSINIFITLASMDNISSTYLADSMATILPCSVFIMAAAQACTMVTPLAPTQVTSSTYIMATT